MIERDGGENAYVLTCDKCIRHDSIRTARSMDDAKRVATFLKWATDTPHGDLCPFCRVQWNDGAFDDEK